MVRRSISSNRLRPVVAIAAFISARISARYDDEIGVAARRHRRLDLLDHEFGRHQVLDAGLT